MFDIISLVASIATLMLFVIYFIGRVWTILATRWICEERISLISSDDDDNDNYNIVETFHLSDDECYADRILLTSVNGIYDFKIYKCEYDIEKGLVSKEKIENVSFVNVGNSIEIITRLPDWKYEYMIEFTTNDFRKVTLPLCDNLKSGVISEFWTSRHTIKSVLYQLFR